MSEVSGLVHAQIYDLHILGPARRLVVVTGQLLPRLSAARPLLQTANQIAASLTADQSEPGDTGGLSLCNNLEQSRQRELTI